MESRGVQQESERLLNEEIAESFFQRVLNVRGRTCRMNISRWTGR